jgi:sterol 3beta-glucosyltransferase
MKVFIVTFGSRGDVQPYVALGKGLKTAGHTVTICTADSFESFVTDNGLNYAYMTGELLKLLNTDAGREAIEDTDGLFGTAKTMLKLVKATKPLNREMMEDSVKAAEIVQPDIVIYHPKALGGVHIAEKYNVPAVMAMLQPMMVPTAEFPPIGLPDLKIGGWYNKMVYGLIPMGYRTYAKDIDEVRQEKMGLVKFPKSSGVTQTAAGRPITILHGYSRHVLPQPADWPAHAHVNGYWFLDQQENWTPPADLQRFLEAGPPPIYVGFGSMAGRNPQRLADIVISALQKANLRGIIATGWGGLDAGELPETIYKIDQAPHDWLFPRMAAVVHHGGAGTTAASLRAGKPTIICPFFGDQPFWGRRVHDLGAGPQPIPQKKLSADKLAGVLQTVTHNQPMHDRATLLGKQIRQEDGIAHAVSIIEQTTAL